MTALRGRLLLLAGVALAVLGVVAFFVQLGLERLSVPWHMPIMAFLGAALIAASLWERRTVWRVLALIAVTLLGGFELMALSAMRLPKYTGPIAVGQPFPAFQAQQPDGAAFTQDDLAGDRRSVMVFFRGRW